MSIKPPISGFNREHQADRRDMFPAALLSVAVHGALFVGLFTAFQWNTSEEAVYAELWAPEEISGGNDPSGVAEKLPEVKSKDTEEQQEEKAAAPEPNPQSLHPLPSPNPPSPLLKTSLARKPKKLSALKRSRSPAQLRRNLKLAAKKPNVLRRSAPAPKRLSACVRKLSRPSSAV